MPRSGSQRGVRSEVGLDDRKALFQPNWFAESALGGSPHAPPHIHSVRVVYTLHHTTTLHFQCKQYTVLDWLSALKVFSAKTVNGKL